MTGALIQAGGVGGFVDLDSTYSAYDFSLTVASARIKFRVDGFILNQDNNELGNGLWFNPTGGSPGDSYEIRATPAPDTPSSGTMNTWLALSTQREWATNSASGTNIDTFTIEIRPVGGSVIGTTTVTLEAEQSP